MAARERGHFQLSLEKNLRVRVVDLRDFTHDNHRTVDDAPYGGGPGMVMKPDPFFEAVESLGAVAPIVLQSARAKRPR